MATLNLVLDKRRVKKDCTYPVVFRLSANRKQAFIPTGISINEQDYDEKNSLVINSPKLNEDIYKLDRIYRKRFYQYIIENSGCEDVLVLKNYLLNKTSDELTVYEFWEDTIKKLKNVGRNGGCAIYQQSLNTISQEINLKIPFLKLSYRDIIDLETKLYQRGMSINGIGVYMRTFRAICNRAINLDFVGYEWYPFRKYKIQKSKTTPRVLSMEEIKSYFHLDLQVEDPEYKYWNLGKLIFMLRGINMRDLLLLKKENIVNGRLIYKRAKTGKIYSIALTKDIEASLGVFCSTTTLLGLINLEKSKGERCIKYLQQHVKVINNHLKNLSRLIQSKEPITTYVFRYSYANVAKQLGYSKDLIAEALGHEYGNSVTGIYLEQFDNDIVDKMNQNLINSVVKSV